MDGQALDAIRGHAARAAGKGYGDVRLRARNRDLSATQTPRR